MDGEREMKWSQRNVEESKDMVNYVLPHIALGPRTVAGGSVVRNASEP
jgi:hypothetical protein